MVLVDMNNKIREVYCYMLSGFRVSSSSTSPHYYWFEVIDINSYRFLLRIDRTVE